MATLVWRRRGWISAAFLVLAAVFLLFGIDRITNSALATAGTSSYVVPPVVDTNPDPDIVETTITAEPAAVDIGGSVLANVLTFNGTVPGPEFRLKVGDTVIVHYENHLGHNSGIHWHGIELANASDGTPLTQNQVPPFGTFLYKFRVTRPGIYWYHPHHHSSTNQVFKGLYGSIIVTDPNEAALVAAGRIPGPDQTLTMALSDITVCKSFGTNDLVNFNPALPWVGGGPLPAQSNSPKSLCETSPIDE